MNYRLKANVAAKIEMRFFLSWEQGKERGAVKRLEKNLEKLITPSFALTVRTLQSM